LLVICFFFSVLPCRFLSRLFPSPHVLSLFFFFPFLPPHLFFCGYLPLFSGPFFRFGKLRAQKDVFQFFPFLWWRTCSLPLRLQLTPFKLSRRAPRPLFPPKWGLSFLLVLFMGGDVIRVFREDIPFLILYFTSLCFSPLPFLYFRAFLRRFSATA